MLANIGFGRCEAEGGCNGLRLQRIRDRGTARLVAQGVRRFNGVSLSIRRILNRPHYAIVRSGKIAGWIGIERRSSGVYELCHLSVLPRYRRAGLGESASRQSIAVIRSWGGHYAYTRIVRNNKPSINLIRKFGFRQTRGGRVLIFGRSV